MERNDSREISNQLKKKQYEEYIKRKNKYYIYMKKYYKEYVENQKKYSLDRKRGYEDYIKSKKKYYIYKKKYDEEYSRINNYILENSKIIKKIDTSQSEVYNSLKTDSTEENNINKDSINKDSIKNNNNNNSVKNNSSLNVEELYNERFLEKKYEESLRDNIEDKKEESIEDGNLKNSSNSNSNSNSNRELYNKEVLEENNQEYLKDNIEDKKDEWIEDDKLKDKNSNSSSSNSKEVYNEKSLEEEYEEYLGKKDEKFLGKDHNIIEKKDLSEKTEISTVGLYGKFPVILAEVNLTIPVEGTISFDEEVMEIKRTRKNVFLTKSHIIPFYSKDMDQSSTILFIEGIVKNNIEYEAQSKTTMGKNNFCGNIKCCTIEIPFDFTTKITFFRLPIFSEKTTTRELDVFTDKYQVGDIYKDSVIGCELYEESSVFTEVFNEKPFVELVKATFIEIDINKNITNEEHSMQKFTEIKEKIILNLTLKVLQKQQVRVFIE